MDPLLRGYVSPPSKATAHDMNGDKGFVAIKFRCVGCSRQWSHARPIGPSDWSGGAWAHEIIVPELIREMRDRGYAPGEPVSCFDCRGAS
jgi:hypothetical protein